MFENEKICVSEEQCTKNREGREREHGEEIEFIYQNKSLLPPSFSLSLSHSLSFFTFHVARGANYVRVNFVELRFGLAFFVSLSTTQLHKFVKWGGFYESVNHAFNPCSLLA
jgi:hypothetical protein